MLLKIGENLKAKAKLECYEKLSEKSLFTFMFFIFQFIYLFIHSFRDSFICLIIYLFIQKVQSP